MQLIWYFSYTKIMLDDTEPPQISQELRDYIAGIKAKRARIVLNHILQYGYNTTKDLQETYGYDHPPRAAKDVRDNGIQLKTTMKVIDGKRMAVYTLDEDSFIEAGKSGGRRPFTKTLKDALLSRDGEQCALCKKQFPGNVLQIDHKVPYEVAGDKQGILNTEDFMLVCASCNRAKSWTCEHCSNWQFTKTIEICQSCMFGSPDNYSHIAMREERSLTVSWYDKDVQIYDNLKDEALMADQSIEDYVKNILKAHIQNDQSDKHV